MSDLITDLNQVNMPNFNSPRAEAQWLEGKPTRNEMAAQVANAMKMIENAVNGQMQQVNHAMNVMFNMNKINGMQIQTIIRVIDQAVKDMPDKEDVLKGKTFVQKFEEEFVKTQKAVMFLESLDPNSGSDGSLPMEQKLEKARSWNANEQNVKVKGFQFGLEDYVKTNMNKYSEEDVEVLNEEFQMKIKYVPNVVEFPTKEEVVEKENTTETSS